MKQTVWSTSLPNWSRMVQYARTGLQLIARVLQPSTVEEAERRRGHALALLLIGTVATAKHVTGLTLNSAPFTLYGLAAAISAAYGGFAPGLVAALAALLLVNVDAQPRMDTWNLALFGVEAIGLAALVAAGVSRIRALEAELTAAQDSLSDLEERFRRERQLDAASRDANHRAWCAYRDAAT